MAYNANAFMLHFYDKKTGYEFVTFDRSGKQTGSHIVSPKLISKLDLNRVSTNIAANSDVIDIFPMGSNGFIRNTYAKNKKTGYELTAFDNNAKVLWTLASDEKSPMHEMLEIADVSETIIAGTLMKKKSLMTKEMDSYTLLINPKSGKLISEIPLGSEMEGV
ncbi:MAG: hypothetical protein KJ941_12605, partial [Bacteroidetes bacterium]|nr:hypothetical protein [Bacteroidota bacterium]